LGCGCWGIALWEGGSPQAGRVANRVMGEGEGQMEVLGWGSLRSRDCEIFSRIFEVMGV